MEEKSGLGKNYKPKPLKIPKLKIGEQEKKPFTMWYLINKSRLEFKFNWNFFGGKKNG